jgi:hypothetical protein
MDGQQVVYCCACKADTPHTLVPDPYFKVGLMCLICKIVWEIELPPEEQAF